MPFKDLREFLSLLEQKGDLLRTKKPVDVKVRDLFLHS